MLDRPPAPLPRVVFLCYGNACRSQMAEAYARSLGGDLLEPVSAGINPIGFIPPEVAIVMEEDGLSMEGHHPKSLHEVRHGRVDLIVDLAGFLPPDLDGIPVRCRPVIDPFGGDLEDYRRTREEVRREVEALLAELRA